MAYFANIPVANVRSLQSISSENNYYISVGVLASVWRYQLGHAFIILSHDEIDTDQQKITVVDKVVGFYPSQGTINRTGLLSLPIKAKLRNRHLFTDFMANPSIGHLSFVIDPVTYQTCCTKLTDLIGDNLQEKRDDDLPQFETCGHNCWQYAINFVRDNTNINAPDYLWHRIIWNLPTTIYWQLGSVKFAPKNAVDDKKSYYWRNYTPGCVNYGPTR